MHFIESINVLLAKLTKEQFEPYRKFWSNEDFQERYDDIFGPRKPRLHFDFEFEIKKEDIVLSEGDEENIEYLNEFIEDSTKRPGYSIHTDILYHLKVGKFLRYVA